MSETKAYRLSKVASEFNVGIPTIVEFLNKKGHSIDTDPNKKIAPELYALLLKEYSSDISAKIDAKRVNLRSYREKKGTIEITQQQNETRFEEEEEHEPPILIKDTSLGIKTPLFTSHRDLGFKVIGKIDLNENKPKKQDSKSKKKKDGKQQQQKDSKQQQQKDVKQQQQKDVKQQQQKDVKQQQPKDVKQQQPKDAKKQQQQKDAKQQQQKDIKQQQQKDVNLQPIEVDKIIPTAIESSDMPEKYHEEIPDIKHTEQPSVEVVEEKVEVTELPDTLEKEIKERELLVEPELDGELKVIGKIDLSAINQRTRPKKKSKKQLDQERKARTQQHKAAQSSKTRTLETPRQKPKSEKDKIKDKIKEKERAGKEKVKGKDKDRILTADIKKTKKKEEPKRDLEIIRSDVKLTGPTVVGKIDLAQALEGQKSKKKRKRIHKDKEKVVLTDKLVVQKRTEQSQLQLKTRKKKPLRPEVSDEDVQKQIKETLSRLTAKSAKSKSAKYRRDKRDAVSMKLMEEEELQQSMKNVLKVTEFISVNEFASLMEVPVTQVISTCMNIGKFVSINQRLDAEMMIIVADEFNYKIEFISADSQDVLVEEVDSEEDLQPRPPIVTVMGHVDHGKTKLLDYVRNTNVIAGEAGGITQHIGAYSVTLDEEKQITFLDTPGHEAFTAMRARGAKVTDVAIIVVAADDGVKQQTIEAINHASAAGVPIVFAINKMDKPEASLDKVREELANMNYLVEEWGGKYQSQAISAKAGLNIELLLEKVLLEAEMLELKANPDRNASGTVIESALDKGRGYVATVLVQNGTLRTGDVVLAGSCTGNVKAMYNERNQKINEAGPATPVLILGLDGAPQAGDLFNVLDNFREAREIASKRSQLQREQGMRTKKILTLEEIGRRIAIGTFKELNIIVKCDVDGSVEALAGSLIQLSTPEIQINVIHRAVGQISESDVSLAAASNAVIVGFQVRPSLNARKLAEQEQIDIRIHSIIYDAIAEIKSAMEGMLSPEIKEEISATLEVREVFKITKVGMVAGCIVREGKIMRTSKIRIIRDGIVIHTGLLGSLKRFKDDVKEVAAGFECGLDVANFNDIQVGDIIEGYVEIEVKRKL